MKYIISLFLLICCFNTIFAQQSKHFNKGVEYYSISKYEKATKEFEAAFKATNDYMALYNAGVSASANQDFAKAIDYFKRCIDEYYYSNGDVFMQLADCYVKTNENLSAKKVLDEAFPKYPLSQGIITSIINLYSNNQYDFNELIALLNEAKKNYPNNAALCYVEGNIYNHICKYDDAIKAYENASQIDSTYIFGDIGIGVLYYNKALEIQDKSSNISMEDMENLVNEFDNTLLNAIEPFERAYSKATDNDIRISIAEYLMNIYSRFKDKNENYMRKYEEYSAIVENSNRVN